MNWENHGKWEVDHIIPIKSAKNEEELIAILHHKNLQPLWKEENSTKRARFNPKDKEEYLDWYSKNVVKNSNFKK